MQQRRLHHGHGSAHPTGLEYAQLTLSAVCAHAGNAISSPSTKNPTIKEVLPAGSLEAFASNRKLREQLEEVRSTVAHAKAQVDAAGGISKAQVPLLAPPDCHYHEGMDGTRIRPDLPLSGLSSITVACLLRVTGREE